MDSIVHSAVIGPRTPSLELADKRNEAFLAEVTFLAFPFLAAFLCLNCEPPFAFFVNADRRGMLPIKIKEKKKSDDSGLCAALATSFVEWVAHFIIFQLMAQ